MVHTIRWARKTRELLTLVCLLSGASVYAQDPALTPGEETAAEARELAEAMVEKAEQVETKAEEAAEEAAESAEQAQEAASEKAEEALESSEQVQKVVRAKAEQVQDKAEATAEKAKEVAASWWETVKKNTQDAQLWFVTQWNRLFSPSKSCPDVPGKQCPAKR